MKRCSFCKQTLPHESFNRVSTRYDGLSTYCRTCSKQKRLARKEKDAERFRRYRVANIEREKERHRRHYEANKVRILEKQKTGKNKERHREHTRRYAEKNKERVSLQQKEWYAANRNKVLEQQKEYYEKNKSKALERSRTRRARKKGAAGSYTDEQWHGKCEYYAYRCYLCGVDLAGQTVHCDHRIPLSRGGSNWLANAAPACAKCNLSKGTKTEAEFRELQSLALTAQQSFQARPALEG